MKLRKGADVMLGAHFNSKEIDCPCTKCDTTLIDLDLIEKLEKVRESSGFVLHILSGYRCADKQAQLTADGYPTAKGISQHQLGRAADIKSTNLSGKELAEVAEEAGFMAIGIAKAWIHCDLRSEKVRRWSYAR